MLVQHTLAHPQTHFRAPTFALSSQPALCFGDSAGRGGGGLNAPNAHQPYRRVSTLIAMCISQAKQVNYFPALFSFFTLPLRREAPCGMDVMRWSTQKAIFSSVCTITFI